MITRIPKGNKQKTCFDLNNVGLSSGVTTDPKGSNISSSWGGGGELEFKEFYSNKHASYRQHLLTLTFFSPILG